MSCMLTCGERESILREEFQPEAMLFGVALGTMGIYERSLFFLGAGEGRRMEETRCSVLEMWHLCSFWFVLEYILVASDFWRGELDEEKDGGREGAEQRVSLGFEV